MSFLTRQDRTPQFAGQVLPDRTESGLIFLTFYLTSMGYQFSYNKVPGHKFGVKNLNWDVFENEKKNLEKKNLIVILIFFFDFFLFLKVLKVWILKICRTFGPDVMSGRDLIYSKFERSKQFLQWNAFLTCSWRCLRSNTLEKLEFKFEKLLGF
jgi:hypothetical protein